MKNTKYNTLFILVITLLISQKSAFAEIISTLNNDTVTIRIFGAQLNNSSALNLKLSFSNPDIAKLSSSLPIFEANGATQLLTASDPDSGTVTVIWDGYIPTNEAKITFMLEPGSIRGITTVLIDKVEAAYGIDITNNIALVVDNPTVVNSFGTEVTPLGKFTLLDPGKLNAPGTAAIAFKAENISSNLTAKINGLPVTFLDNDTGVSEVSLPAYADELNIVLEVNSGNEKRIIGLGKVKLTKALTTLYPPIIDRAYVFNRPDSSKLNVYGRHFGIGRFGRGRVNVEVIPGNPEVSNKNLRRKSTNDNLDNIGCIPIGSYVNISHPAGTTTKKIKVLGGCN